MKKALVVILVVLAAAGFGIFKLYTSVSKAGETGDAAVAVFHGDYNAKQSREIYARSAAAFRSSVTEADFSNLAAMLHEKLGERKSGERSGINLKSHNGHTTLELSYDSKFAKASGTEEFVFDYNGDTPLLLGYNVKSPALLEKAAEKPLEAAKP